MGRRLDALLFGPARRGRAMRKRLEALDRADARMLAAGIDPLDAWLRERDPRQAPPTTGPPQSTKRRRGPLIVLVLVLTAVLTAYAVHYRQGSGAAAGLDSTRSLRPSDVPPLSHEEQSRPLGTPVAAPAGSGGYEFERVQAGSSAPVTWDPCRPIHYVLNGDPPPGQAGLIASVVAELSALTGLRFIDDGPTSELPLAAESRASYQPARYGARWAPVLVAWTDARQVPALAGSVVGLGGAAAVSIGSPWATYVTGIVYLDRPDLVRYARQPGGAGQLRAVVLHEFGHLLGLAHVSDPASVMYPETHLTVTGYSAGDLRGMHAVSTGRCAPNV